MSEHLSSALARRDFACAERFQRTLPVVVTTASATYARVLEAWSTRLDAYGVAQRVVIALGLGVDAACRVRYDVASPDLLAGIVGLSKFEVSHALLELGHRVLYSELDVVWLADASAAAAGALAGRSGGSFDAADAVAAMDNERDDELNVGFVLATPGPVPLYASSAQAPALQNCPAAQSDAPQRQCASATRRSAHAAAGCTTPTWSAPEGTKTPPPSNATAPAKRRGVG